MSKTIEKLLRENLDDNGFEGSEFILRCQNEYEDGSIEFYISPYNRSGETLNFTVKDNKIGKSQFIIEEVDTKNIINGFPRRNRIDLNKPSELAIRNAIEEVEKLGADVKLTDAVIKLNESLELVSDFIDNQIEIE